MAKDILPLAEEARGLLRNASAHAKAEGRKVALPDIAIVFLSHPSYGRNMAAARVTRESIMSAGRLGEERVPTPIDESERPYSPKSTVKTMVRGASRLAEAKREAVIGIDDVFKTMFSMHVGGFQQLLDQAESPRELSATLMTGHVDPDQEYNDQQKAYVRKFQEENNRRLAADRANLMKETSAA